MDVYRKTDDIVKQSVMRAYAIENANGSLLKLLADLLQLIMPATICFVTSDNQQETECIERPAESKLFREAAIVCDSLSSMIHIPHKRIA